MGQENSVGRSHPFHIGQPHDDVVYVCKRTGRRRKSMKVIAIDGTPLADSESVNLGADLTIESVYPDVTLIFKRSRLPDDTGAMCYRVAEIREGKSECCTKQ